MTCHGHAPGYLNFRIPLTHRGCPAERMKEPTSSRLVGYAQFSFRTNFANLCTYHCHAERQVDSRQTISRFPLAFKNRQERVWSVCGAMSCDQCRNYSLPSPLERPSLRSSGRYDWFSIIGGHLFQLQIDQAQGAPPDF